MPARVISSFSCASQKDCWEVCVCLSACVCIYTALKYDVCMYLATFKIEHLTLTSFIAEVFCILPSCLHDVFSLTSTVIPVISICHNASVESGITHQVILISSVLKTHFLPSVLSLSYEFLGANAIQKQCKMTEEGGWAKQVVDIDPVDQGSRLV